MIVKLPFLILRKNKGPGYAPGPLFSILFQNRY